MFSPELRSRAEELIGRYPVKRSALLPLLHLVQHQDGHVSPEGVAELAELLEITKAEVGAVATFYTMFKREEMGRHLVSVCTSFSCAVRGGSEVYERLSAKLGVGQNETTEDGAITLEHAECLGNCEGAPVVTVDYFNYECQSPEDAERLVDQLADGQQVPSPTRGEVPTGVRALSFRLAGLGPVAAPDGEIAQANRLARAHHGGETPQAMATSGPGHEPVRVVPTFSAEDEEERARAKAAVRDTGMEPTDVEDTAGASAREFPTTDPDWSPREPGAAPGGESATPPEDPRGEEMEDADRDADRRRSTQAEERGGETTSPDDPQGDAHDG